MGGTKAGGYKACATNKRKYGDDWYARIGKIGGSKTGLKGFALNNELAKSAGRKGGLKSKRGPGKRNKDGSVKHSYDYVVKHLIGNK
jgi:general stress protein YciG